jgi:anti-sigma factor RsiW
MSPAVNAPEPSEERIEALAFGQLSAEERAEVEEAVAASAEASARLHALQREGTVLRRAAADAEEGGGTEGLSNEVLARYLDGALDDADRAAVEESLSRSGALRERLVVLYRAAAVALGPQQEVLVSLRSIAGESVSFEEGQGKLREAEGLAAKGAEEVDEPAGIDHRRDASSQ